MFRKAVSGLMLMLLLIGISTWSLNIQLVKSEPKTWIVDDDGPADFHTIQEAINAAASGDTIFVCNGTYYENLVVTKNNLTIIGESSGLTIIEGNGTVAVDVIANNTSISGFTIRNNSPYMPASGIRIYGFNNKITHNKLENNGYGGIALIGLIMDTFHPRRQPSSNNVIFGNNITHNEVGVVLFFSTNNTLIENNIAHNIYGIKLEYSSNNTLSDNNVTANNENGIGLSDSSNNIISGNIIVNNENGICIGSCSNNSISTNIVAYNLRGIALAASSNNSIYHNNFIDNAEHVYVSSWVFSPSINIWDDGYPSGGNYWSDYTGLDNYSGPYQNETGSDGIGDTPYIIDEYNVDNYPLMAPFSSYTITWNGETYPIDFVTNSTILNLSFDGVEKSLRFDVMGPANTLGMCRVTIPKSLMRPSTWEKWQITVDDSLPLSTNIIEDMENTYLYFTYTHSTRKVEIRIVSQKTLLGRGWGWMRIAPKQYIHGPAKLYKIEENQIELTITHQGKEYSKTWKIIWHKEYRNHELYLCYSPKNGPLIVMLQKTRWKIWLAIGKNTIAYGFPRFQRPRLMRT